MTVGELIEELKAFPLDVEVVRGDADWGAVKITEVREAFIYGVEGAKHGWEDYDYCEDFKDEDDAPRSKAIKLS